MLLPTLIPPFMKMSSILVVLTDMIIFFNLCLFLGDITSFSPTPPHFSPSSLCFFFSPFSLRKNNTFNYNFTDSSGGNNNNNNAAAPDHNLDLSLGNSSASKQSCSSNSNSNRDNPPLSSGSVQFQVDWRHQGLRPKVHVHSYLESRERERQQSL